MFFNFSTNFNDHASEPRRTFAGNHFFEELDSAVLAVEFFLGCMGTVRSRQAVSHLKPDMVSGGTARKLLYHVAFFARQSQLASVSHGACIHFVWLFDLMTLFRDNLVSWKMFSCSSPRCKARELDILGQAAAAKRMETPPLEIAGAEPPRRGCPWLVSV